MVNAATLLDTFGCRWYLELDTAACDFQIFIHSWLTQYWEFITCLPRRPSGWVRSISNTSHFSSFFLIGDTPPPAPVWYSCQEKDISLKENTLGDMWQVFSLISFSLSHTLGPLLATQNDPIWMFHSFAEGPHVPTHPFCRLWCTLKDLWLQPCKVQRPIWAAAASSTFPPFAPHPPVWTASVSSQCTISHT